MATKQNPCHADQRGTGAGLDCSATANIQPNFYANPAKFQAQRLRHRFGLSGTKASLLAELCFGEVQS